MSEFETIFMPMNKIFTIPEIKQYIHEKYNLVINNVVNHSGFSKTRLNRRRCIEIVDSNLTFKETLKWIEGVLIEDKDIYQDDPDKIIIVNGGNYKSIPGRGYAEIVDFPLSTTSEIIIPIRKLQPVVNISGFTFPREATSCKSVKNFSSFASFNVIDGSKYMVSTGDGPIVNIDYSDLTSFELINWMNHIVFEGKNIYPNREIVYSAPEVNSVFDTGFDFRKEIICSIPEDDDTYDFDLDFNLDEEIKAILKDCIPLRKFKKNLLSK